MVFRDGSLNPHFPPDFLGNDVAHALCVPRRHSWRRSASERCVAARRSVEKSLDTARVGVRHVIRPVMRTAD